MIPWLDSDVVAFPPVDLALQSPNGLLAAGGDLTPEWLICAYQQGIFPWFEADQPILWWTPDPRMVLYPQEFHLSASLRRLLGQHRFGLSIDQDFAGVITGCSEPRRYTESTWITSELKTAYQKLHDLGIAHSVEVWDEERLVGGLYGVALGRIFFGESMFSRSSNTSKLALVFLVQHLRKWRYRLIDCQVSTPHLASLGAREIPRRDFMEQIDRHVGGQRKPATWQAVAVTRNCDWDRDWKAQ